MKTTLVLDEKAEERTYSIAEKICFCKFVLVCMEQDLVSLNSIGNEVGVSLSCFSHWLNHLPQYFFIAKHDQVRYILHGGHKNQLDCIGAELLAVVANLQESWYAILRKILIAQALRILGSDSFFSLKTYAVCTQSVSCWMRKNNLTLRAGTHQAQAPPYTAIMASANFIVNVIQPAVSLAQPHHHKDFIINMDQTPVFFWCMLLNPLRWLAPRQSTFALPLCFTASGVQLKLMVIFKCESGFSFCYNFITASHCLCYWKIRKRVWQRREIITNKHASYLVRPIYITQEKAWMSKSLMMMMMMMWVEHCLAPYIAMSPDRSIPILFLDSYSVHKMGSVNCAISNHGVKVIILPAGCTNLAQPVKIGYNKLFKELVHNKNQNWMVTESKDLKKAPWGVDVTQWIVEAESMMKELMLENSWMRKPMEYFPQIDVTVPEVVQVEALLDGAPVISNMEEDWRIVLLLFASLSASIILMVCFLWTLLPSI